MTETERVLKIKLCGVDTDIEERFVGGEESRDLSSAVESLADELGISFEMLSVGVSDEHKRRPPSRDADSVDPAEGWEGGDVVHTGGGIFCRIFNHPEKHLELIYDYDDPELGVGLYAEVYDEDWGYFNNGNELANVGSIESEQDAVEACKELMQQVNDGEFEAERLEIQD